MSLRFLRLLVKQVLKGLESKQPLRGIMSIPDYQTLMLPLLKIAGDGNVHTKRDAVNELAALFGVSEEERKELLPSGNQAVFDNRVGWARTYLKKAMLISYVQRGQFQITERGQSGGWRRIHRVSTLLIYGSSLSFWNSISPLAPRLCKNRYTSPRRQRKRQRNCWQLGT